MRVRASRRVRTPCAWTARGCALLAALAAVAALAEPATAQDAGGAGVLEATYALHVTVPTGALRERYDSEQAQSLPVPGLPPVGGSCGSGHFFFNQTGNWFRFREEQ